MSISLKQGLNITVLVMMTILKWRGNPYRYWYVLEYIIVQSWIRDGKGIKGRKTKQQTKTKEIEGQMFGSLTQY